MAGGAAAAADLRDAVGQISAFKLALTGVFSIKMDKIHVTFHEIQTKAQCTFQHHIFSGTVLNGSGTGDDVFLFENAVEKCHIDLFHPILQRDLQRFCLFFLRLKKCRKTGKAVFAFSLFVRNKTQIQSRNFSLETCFQCFHTEITVSLYRILQRVVIHGIGAVLFFIPRLSGKASVFRSDQIRKVGFICCRPIVSMKKNPVIVYLHLISAVCSLKCK